MGRPWLGQHDGVLLPGVQRIHTAFMRMPIDVIWLRDGRVVGINEGVEPWRMRSCAAATQVLEVAAGRVSGSQTIVGDRIKYILHASRKAAFGDLGTSSEVRRS